MKNLLIIGGRGFGREVYETAISAIGYETEFVIKGFLDDKTDALDGFSGYPPIIDSVEHYTLQPEDAFICALGDPSSKNKYVDLILKKGGNFINIIDSHAIISPHATIGNGCIVRAFTTVSCDVMIGNFVTIQGRTTIGHDVMIDDFCQISSGCFLGGSAKVGKLTTIYPNATVLPHISVGNQAIVGAGSVVIKNVKNQRTVFGNPAKEL